MRLVGAFALVFGVSSVAWAQGNYRSAALGGRSALMGDTGVALGTDGAAPFLNPATVVRVESTLALSVTFVSIDLLHASSWYTPGPIDPKYGNVPTTGTDIARVSGNAIPSTLCLFTGLPKLGHADADNRTGKEELAACLGTTENQAFDWTGQGYQPAPGAGATSQASSVRSSWQRFVVAPTYAVHVSDSLAIGSSLQATFTNFGSSASVGAITSGGAIAPTSSGFEVGTSGSDFGLSALLGATLTLGKLHIGATVQSPDLSVYGHGNISSYVQYATAATQSATTYLGQGGFHAREPTRMSLGIGWEWPHGSIELDAQLALADGHALELDAQGTQVTLPTAASTSQALSLTTRFQPTVNVSAGTEIFVRRSLSILAGVATDFSAVDGLTPTSLAPAQINRVLASFGLGSHSDAGTLLIGAQGYLGWGKMFAPNVYASPPVETPTDVQTFGVLFVLAGTTNLKTIVRAVEDVRSLVTKPPPSPSP